jgi:hypothetical protein
MRWRRRRCSFFLAASIGVERLPIFARAAAIDEGFTSDSGNGQGKRPVAGAHPALDQSGAAACMRHNERLNWRFQLLMASLSREVKSWLISFYVERRWQIGIYFYLLFFQRARRPHRES